MNWIALLLVLMLTPQAWSLRVHQEITLVAGEMVISIRIPVQTERNITLTWPIYKDEVLTLPQPSPEMVFQFDASEGLSLTMRPVLERGVETSFKIRYDLVLGRGQILPVPRCLEEETTVFLEVVLPPGLVAVDCVPVCTKSYDHGVRSMRLSWAGLDEGGCQVTLVEPGRGENELAAEVRRILLRSYLFWATCLLLFGLVVFAAFRLARQPR